MYQGVRARMSWKIPAPSLRMNCGRNLKYRLDLLVEVPVDGTQGGSLEKPPEPGDNAVTVVRARGATALYTDMRLQASSDFSFTSCSWNVELVR